MAPYSITLMALIAQSIRWRKLWRAVEVRVRHDRSYSPSLASGSTSTAAASARKSVVVQSSPPFASTASARSRTTRAAISPAVCHRSSRYHAAAISVVAMSSNGSVMPLPDPASDADVSAARAIRSSGAPPPGPVEPPDWLRGSGLAVGLSRSTTYPARHGAPATGPPCGVSSSHSIVMLQMCGQFSHLPYRLVQFSYRCLCRAELLDSSLGSVRAGTIPPIVVQRVVSRFPQQHLAELV